MVSADSLWNLAAASATHLAGVLLKEALEDLEWAAAGGHVQLAMRRDLQRIALSASSINGDMRIELPQVSRRL